MADEFTLKGGELIDVPNGEHTGVIQDLTKTPEDAEFQYYSIEIAMEDVKTSQGTPVVLRYSMPVPKYGVTDGNKVGRTLLSMGAVEKIEKDGTYNLKELLLGKRCKFMTKKKKSKKDPSLEFAEIIDLIEKA